MIIKINNVVITCPKEFSVTPMDLDNGESSVRTSNGTLTRDRIAVKRQIDMAWGILTWNDIAIILQAMSGIFFDVFYPDAMEGTYITKTFYVGNRPCPIAFEINGVMMWDGLKVTLTER